MAEPQTGSPEVIYDDVPSEDPLSKDEGQYIGGRVWDTAQVAAGLLCLEAGTRNR